MNGPTTSSWQQQPVPQQAFASATFIPVSSQMLHPYNEHSAPPNHTWPEGSISAQAAQEKSSNAAAAWAVPPGNSFLNVYRTGSWNGGKHLTLMTSTLECR